MTEMRREGRPFVVHFRVPGRREAVTVALREVPGTEGGAMSVFAVGVASCSGADQFSKRIGAMIAMNRLDKYGVEVQWDRENLFGLAWFILEEGAAMREKFRRVLQAGYEPSAPRWLPEFVEALLAQRDHEGAR